MVPSSRLIIVQCLVHFFAGSSVAVGGQWAGCLSVCLPAVVYLSLLRWDNFFTPPFVIRAVISAGIIVGVAALCLSCSNGRAAGIMDGLGQSNDDLPSVRVLGIAVVATSSVVAEHVGEGSGGQLCGKRVQV